MLSRQWRWVCLVLATATVVGVVAAHKAASTGRGRYRALLKNLLAVSANSRSTEARITGFLQWNPAPEALRGGSSSIPGDVHIAALLLRDAVGLAEDVEELRSAACAHLALGDALAAVEALEEAALISPETASIRADLSGALYEQWRQGGQSIDLVRAVEESSIALMRDPLSKEAAFNQALSLSGLKLRRAAEGAWTRFLHIDGTSPWAVEARARRSAVLTKDAQWTPPSEHGSDAEMDRVVAGAATSVYRFIELELERWSAAVLSGSRLRFDVAERLANALARSGADAYLAGVWRDVRMSEHWPAQRRRALALGMRQVLRWRALIDAGAYAAAEPVAAEAHDALRAAGFDTVEADLEIGYSDFVAGRTAAALTRLAQVEARGRRGGFWRIAAKAIRLQGLSAALATRVSEAQAHYEAGSVLAERSGDAELQVLFDTFLGETLGQQGDMRAAWRLLTRTLPWLPDLSLMRQRFDVLNACANAARRTGLDHTSMLFAGEMLEAMSGWPNPEGRIVGHFLRARGMAHLGVGDRGVRDLDAAASLVEQLADRPQAQARLKAEVNAYRAYSFAGHDDRAARSAASEAIAYFSDAVQLLSLIHI